MVRDLSREYAAAGYEGTAQSWDRAAVLGQSNDYCVFCTASGLHGTHIDPRLTESRHCSRQKGDPQLFFERKSAKCEFPYIISNRSTMSLWQWRLIVLKRRAVDIARQFCAAVTINSTR